MTIWRRVRSIYTPTNVSGRISMTNPAKAGKTEALKQSGERRNLGIVLASGAGR